MGGFVIGRYRRRTSLGVNLRRERFVPTGPLNPKLPPRQTHSRAAGSRHDRLLESE